ncbi:hypothetical protein [Zobellia barbeyronii]|nr:hypothetical protein [Zobellia barbeyronii]
MKKTSELSEAEAKICNGGGFWAKLFNYLLEQNEDYQDFKEHTGQ